MFLSRWLTALGRLWRRPRPDGLRGLPSPDQTQRAIQREQARADRSDTILSVVTFTPPRRDARAAFLAVLARVLQARLRSTDRIGWLDEERLCAVLPDTPPEGAWQVVKDVCQALPTSAPRCAVYRFPGGGFPQEAGCGAADTPLPHQAAALDALLQQAPATKDPVSG
jgi:hypothetical protein